MGPVRVGGRMTRIDLSPLIVHSGGVCAYIAGMIPIQR